MPSFGKVNKNKRFSYKPLYYDKDKEEREKRSKTINIRHAYEREKGRPSRFLSSGSKSVRASRIRKMVLLMMMFFIVYVIFGIGVHFYAELAGVAALFILLVIFIRDVNRS